MDLYKRQQFEFLLHTAVERLTERLEQRHQGCDAALHLLNESPCPRDVSEFTSALFSEFLLDNAEGACFVLGSLSQKRLAQSMTLAAEQTVERALTQLAQQQFQSLLIIKTRELLEQHSRYQAIEVGGETS